LIYLLPQLALHIGLAFLSDDGFLPYLGSNLDVLWKVPLVTAGYLALHGSLVTAVSAVVGRTGVTAAFFLRIVPAGASLAILIGLLVVPCARWVPLLSLGLHPRIVRDRVFAIATADCPAVLAGFGMWTSVAVIAVVAVV